MHTLKSRVLGLFALLAVALGGCCHAPTATPPARTFGVLVNNAGPLFVPTWSGGADMSATLTSDAFRSGDWLSTSVHIEWPATGTPVGVFSFQGSNDSTSGADGHFRPITLTVDNQPAGVADGDLVDFQTMPWRYVRAKYVPTSGGTGALPVVTFLGKYKAQ